MDSDLRSIQEARELVEKAHDAFKVFKHFDQTQVDRIVKAMATAGERAAQKLARHAHEETGFGRTESKKQKNLFATKTLLERMKGMRTVGVIRKLEEDTIWEIGVPMGVVAALIPSTNPTSTAMYKAIIAAKARCGIVMSPHPRAKECTVAALEIVASAAYSAGAPHGLFGCMSEISLDGTNALMEHELTDVILATGGTPMVRAAYSKGKPAYGVGSGNVPVYVDRSADISKAAADITYGTSFDWGTLCSTERSVVVDTPVKQRLIDELKKQQAYFLTPEEANKLRKFILVGGRLNVDQVGKSPYDIARMAGFSIPENSRALVAEVKEVGKSEPLSMETLSPILSFFSEDGWEAGCDRCIEILNFGGIGHTLGIHCSNERVIEEFALKKPAMRIVVNTVCALGSVGYTNQLFPSMTLGPGTIGGSITSDNISPLHLLNIKRLAFETNPINRGSGEAVVAPARKAPRDASATSWITEIEDRLRRRAGSRISESRGASNKSGVSDLDSDRSIQGQSQKISIGPSTLSEADIQRLISKFGKK